MTKMMKRPISIMLAIVMILSMFTIIPVTTASAATKTDELTASDFKATGTSYVDFSGVTKDSGAVYAGQSAKNAAGAIQMRSSGSKSGIVSTTSGGTVKSVKITVASGSNTIDVYGSNTAYTAASDLYNSSKQGTKVGSLTATGTITFTDSYAYVGIRSNSGAVYLIKVEITWDDGSGSGVVVSFEWNVEGNVKRSSYKVALDGYAKKNGKTYYRATCWVAAAEMNYNIHATATINGVLHQDTDDYSVREYGMTILNSPAGTFAHQDELVDLIKKTLDYGTKAQVVFSRPADGPANEGVDYTMATTHDGMEIVDCITAYKGDMNEGLDSLGLTYQGSTIVYLTKTSLRHYYKVNSGASPDLDSIKATAAASGFGYGEKDGMIYFEKKDIAAYELDQAQTLRLSDSAVYTYSVLDYPKQILASDRASENMKQLAMATYWYNDAAKVYFDSIKGA